MIDYSDGLTTHPEVQCVFCPLTVRLETYKPEIGEYGDKLDSPAFLEIPPGYRLNKGWARFFHGKMFTMERNNGIDFLKPYDLVYEPTERYEEKPLAPPFGFGTGKVLWVCSHCFVACGRTSEGVFLNLFKKDQTWAKFYEERHWVRVPIRFLALKKAIIRFAEFCGWLNSVDDLSVNKALSYRNRHS